MTKPVLRPAVFLLALVLTAAGAPPGRAADEGQNPSDPFPHRQFPPLTGKAIGVLASGGQEVLAQEGRRGPADGFCFGSGGGSYRWLYVPVAKKPLIGGLYVPVGTKGDASKRFNRLSTATPATVAHWGVNGPYALVEAEVNGGLGAPPGESFVATHLRTLDGTKEYPLQVSSVVGQLRREFQVYQRQQGDAVEKGLNEARAQLSPGHKVAPGREQTQTVFVTWLPETEQLRVVVKARIALKAYGPVRPAQPLLPTADGTRPAEPASTDGLLLGVELGMTYEVSKLGVLDANRPIWLHRFQKSFAAPLPRQEAQSESDPAPEK
jgi:hypothetical protein